MPTAADFAATICSRYSLDERQLLVRHSPRRDGQPRTPRVTKQLSSAALMHDLLRLQGIVAAETGVPMTEIEVRVRPAKLPRWQQLVEKSAPSAHQARRRQQKTIIG